MKLLSFVSLDCVFDEIKVLLELLSVCVHYYKFRGNSLRARYAYFRGRRVSRSIVLLS